MDSESKQNDPGAWGDCPQGTLVKMVERLSAERRHERRRPLMRVGAVLLIAVACGIGGSWLINDRQSPTPGGLTCAQCAEYMPSHHDGSLAVPLNQQVQAHLNGCPHCREHYENNYSADGGEASSGLAIHWKPRPDDKTPQGVDERAAPATWVLAIGSVAR